MTSLNNDLGINVTGDPLLMIILIGRLLTNAVIVKKSGSLLFTDRVEWIFCFTEWVVFGVQSSSFALLVSFLIKWFTFFYLCGIWQSGLSYRILHISFLWLGIRVTLTSLVPRNGCSRLFWVLSVFPVVLLLVLFYVCSSNVFSFLFRVSHLVCRKCTLLSRRLLLRPTCHFFWFFRS